jgi:hypothetical protein
MAGWWTVKGEFMDSRIGEELGFIRREGLKKHLRRCRQKEADMIARIDANGLLALTMEDIRRGVTFEEATARDVRWSVLPVYRASYITLQHDGYMKVLKARRPLILEEGGTQ